MRNAQKLLREIDTHRYLYDRYGSSVSSCRIWSPWHIEVFCRFLVGSCPLRVEPRLGSTPVCSLMLLPIFWAWHRPVRFELSCNLLSVPSTSHQPTSFSVYTLNQLCQSIRIWMGLSIEPSESEWYLSNLGETNHVSLEPKAFERIEWIRVNMSETAWVLVKLPEA